MSESSRISGIAVLCFYLSCVLACLCMEVAAQDSKPHSQDLRTQYTQKDTSYWVVNFEQFRDALYHRNKAKAKLFFDFPIGTENGELWYMALGENAQIKDTAASLTVFTAKDFERYFDKIFPKELVQGFLKIKLKELYSKGQYETAIWKVKGAKYKLYASYDPSGKTVELNLSVHTAVQISTNEYDTSESNYIYRFTILPNGNIKFRDFFIAG
jgi:hypothetical protein